MCDLQHKSVNVFYTTLRKAIRRLFGLPRNAHCNLLPLVAACLPTQSQLLIRCANFVNSCLPNTVEPMLYDHPQNHIDVVV